ncbi:MAG: cyanophycin synthetase family protein [Eggerthellaceae bacterium]|jgi:hypothetical protein
MADPRLPQRIRIRSLTVSSDRILATVQVDPQHPNSTPAMAAALVQAFPDLPRHACVNPKGDFFGDVIAGTSLPHVLEHLVIDLQTQEHAAIDPDYVFTGVTRWADKAQGVATVEVSYRDDLVALRAFRDAAVYLNSLR